MEFDIIDITGNLYIDMRAKEWCKIPYNNNKNGCPNYNKSKDCPPYSPDIDKFIDLNRKHWFILEKFNILSFQNKMLKKHPDWSIKKARCCLYWQNAVRKRLRIKIENFIDGDNKLIYTLLPESLGINVIKTAKKIGIPIKAKPDNIIIKIALVGYRNYDIKQKKIIEY